MEKGFQGWVFPFFLLFWRRPSPPGPFPPYRARAQRRSGKLGLPPSRPIDPTATTERLSTVAAVPSGDPSHSRRPRGQPGVDVAGEAPLFSQRLRGTLAIPFPPPVLP